MRHRSGPSGVCALGFLLALAGCGGGGSSTASSGSEPPLDGSWGLAVDCNDRSRICSQAGTLILQQGGMVKGEWHSSLEFTGSIAVPNSTCPDLRVPNWPVRVQGSFLSSDGYVGTQGRFEKFYCAGSCIGYPTSWVDVAQPNRLSGRTDCGFSYAGTPPQSARWYAKGTWVAERRP